MMDIHVHLPRAQVWKNSVGGHIPVPDALRGDYRIRDWEILAYVLADIDQVVTEMAHMELYEYCHDLTVGHAVGNIAMSLTNGGYKYSFA